MAEREVLRMGHPELMRSAAPIVEFNTPTLEQLAHDLWDTMAAYGGVGLAATQIGEPWRVVVFGIDDPGALDRLAMPRTVLVNPTIEVFDEAAVDGWEGCLSVPGMRGLVPRHEHIRYSGYDHLGNPLEREASGFHARVVQHECDHLDGILYPMRMTDLGQFGFEEELTLAGTYTRMPCDD